VKLFVAVYLASWVVALSWVAWFALATFGMLGENAKVSPWPLLIAVVAMICAKYVGAMSARKKAHR
jgi:hypothetical protein